MSVREFTDCLRCSGDGGMINLRAFSSFVIG